MGDTIDGSSAAQRAQHYSKMSLKDTESRGLFGRLFDALNPDDEDGADGADSLGQTLPGLANLQRLRVVDVAIPKAEIIAVEKDSSLTEIVSAFRASGYSRIPVYRETLDNPLGLLLLKDLALEYGFNGHHEIDLTALLRPMLFVPPSMPLAVLLRKMQADRTHFALVIDEYGGVDGLVTIEDLLEQVVGEIEDEHDTDDELAIIREGQGALLVDARMPLQSLEDELGFALQEADSEEEIDSLGGLVFVLSGRVPVRGEVINHPSGLEFEVLEAEPRRIKRLRIHFPEALRDPPA